MPAVSAPVAAAFVLAVTGVAFLALGVAVMARDGMKAKARVAKARAIIVRVSVRHLSSARGQSVTLLHPVLRFRDGGGDAHQVTHEVGFPESAWDWAIGDTVEVSYEPGDPQNCLMARTPPERPPLPTLLVGFGTGMLALAAVVFALSGALPTSA